jgi:hypothetical protein
MSSEWFTLSLGKELQAINFLKIALILDKKGK